MSRKTKNERIFYKLKKATYPYVYEFQERQWHALILLAARYHWKPAGTVLHHRMTQKFQDRTWTGSYIAHRGQIVTSEDAVNFADAIEQALDDIPDFITPNKDKVLTEKSMDVYGILSGGGEKDYLREFIKFCRAGEFGIY